MALLHHKTFTWSAFLEKTHPALLQEFFTKEPHLADTRLDTRRALGQVPETVAALGVEGDRITEVIRCIHDMSSDRGAVLLWKANQDLGLGVAFEHLGNHNTAMTMFLRQEDVFWQAWTLSGIEDIESWRLYRGIPGRLADVTTGTLERFSAALSEDLDERHMGKECVTRPHDMGSRLVLEIAHEDMLRGHERFERKRVTVRWWHPVVYAAAVYYPETGILKLKPPRRTREEADLYVQEIGRHLFGDPRSFLDLEVTLDLNRLVQEPVLWTDPRDDLRVDILSLGFHRPDGGAGTSLRLNVGSSIDIRAELERYGMRLDDIEVQAASLRFRFHGQGRAGQRTVHLAAPNKTNLSDRVDDRLIESYLVRWGVLSVDGPLADDIEALRSARSAALRRVAHPVLFNPTDGSCEETRDLEGTLLSREHQ